MARVGVTSNGTVEFDKSGSILRVVLKRKNVSVFGSTLHFCFGSDYIKSTLKTDERGAYASISSGSQSYLAEYTNTLRDREAVIGFSSAPSGRILGIDLSSLQRRPSQTEHSLEEDISTTYGLFVFQDAFLMAVSDRVKIETNMRFPLGGNGWRSSLQSSYFAQLQQGSLYYATPKRRDSTAVAVADIPPSATSSKDGKNEKDQKDQSTREAAALFLQCGGGDIEVMAIKPAESMMFSLANLLAFEDTVTLEIASEDSGHEPCPITATMVLKITGPGRVWITMNGCSRGLLRPCAPMVMGGDQQPRAGAGRLVQGLVSLAIISGIVFILSKMVQIDIIGGGDFGDFGF